MVHFTFACYIYSVIFIGKELFCTADTDTSVCCNFCLLFYFFNFLFIMMMMVILMPRLMVSLLMTKRIWLVRKKLKPPESLKGAVNQGVCLNQGVISIFSFSADYYLNHFCKFYRLKITNTRLKIIANSYKIATYQRKMFASMDFLNAHYYSCLGQQLKFSHLPPLKIIDIHFTMNKIFETDINVQ